MSAASVTVDGRELAAVFTEWDRRFREEPERFVSEAVRLLKGTPETYGEACAPYFLMIVDELRHPPALAVQAPAPAIGERWPEQGGLYAGLLAAKGDQPAFHVILAEAKPPGELTWDRAVEWATSLEADGHKDFTLPTRREGYLLFINLQEQFEQNWHWLGEQYSRTDAWIQVFVVGGQSGLDKSYEGRARAVRRFIA